MHWYRNACAAVAAEGIGGMLRRRVLPLARRGPNRATLRKEYDDLVTAFRAKTAGIDDKDVADYFWYHTVDLGAGLVTPGIHDYRDVLAAFGFPADMSGMSVLDVGSATGFFSFEFARRGADVVSVEVPAFESLDRFPGESVEQLTAKFASGIAAAGWRRREDVDELMRRSAPPDLHRLLLDGPFRFCQNALGAKVDRRYVRIYDLSAATVGREGFDLVFLGDVVLHTIDPLRALAAAASVCSGTLIVVQSLSKLFEPRPAMLYTGGEVLGADNSIWWLPNTTCLVQLLRKLGFSTVEVVGSFSGFMRANGDPYERSVVRALRG